MFSGRNDRPNIIYIALATAITIAQYQAVGLALRRQPMPFPWHFPVLHWQEIFF